MGIFKNNRFRTALAVGLMFFVATATRAGETFHLTGDRQIQGDLIALSRNNIIVRREMGGMAQFAIRDLERIDIETSAGDLISGRLLAFDEGVIDVAGDDLIWSVRNGEILSERSRWKDTETAGHPPADEPTLTGAGGPVVAVRTVDITIRASAVREDAEALRFDITLTPPPEQALTLIYTTMGKSALAEQDYVSTQGVLRIASGTEAASIDVPLLDDDLAEGDENVTLFVTTDPSVAHVGERQVEGTILDDD